jgi:hypothetical protein
MVKLKHVRLYRTEAGWQWEARARNNKTVGTGSKVYRFKWTAKRAIREKYGTEVPIILA